MDYGSQKRRERGYGPSDVEPCVLALHRGSAGPALVPLPTERCSFFFLLHLHRRFSFIFLCLSSLGGGGFALLLWRSLCFLRCRSRFQEPNMGLSRFCLLVDLSRWLLILCSLRGFSILVEASSSPTVLVTGLHHPTSASSR